MPDNGRNNILLTVYNSQMTKADGDPDTAYERQLNRLDCFFYVRGRTDQPCVYYQMVEVDDVGQSTVAFYVNDLVLKEIIPSGQVCDVFVIANHPGTPTFEAKQPGTDIESLGRYVLDMTEGTYDGIDKPFVMTGSGIAVKGRNSTVTAEAIALKRVAAKVTMEVKIPKSIMIDDVKWCPVLSDDQGNVPLLSSFRHGTSKSYLYGDFPEGEDGHIMTDKIPYTLNSETADEYVYKCDIPFYTYARTWQKGSDHAAYITFEMPWGIDENEDGVAEKNINTYYYQILINAGECRFERNNWYDMLVKVGVLGSTVESIPKELEELSYYVLDWTVEDSEFGSGDRHEEVDIQKFNYLEVPQTYIEMNNVPEINIRYNASHMIGVKPDTKAGKSVSALPTTTDRSAFYINNQSGTPQPVDLPVTFKDPQRADAQETAVVSQFTDNNKGLLNFKYELPEDVYSPAYLFVTIWLDVDGDGIHDSDEVLTQDVTIVMYPSIYIVGDNSYDWSIFINGNYNSGHSGGNSLSYLTIAGQRVGKAAGDDANTYMHVISISAFNQDNYMFAYNNNKVKDTQYIIGDPRVRSSNKFGVPDDNATVKQDAAGWVKAKDVNGVVRNLTYYYPTSTETNAYQVIAPKFRIASKLGGYSNSSPQGAAYRCASYQEHGFPAGRWRLPTTAEVLYIIELQRLNKIQQLFYGSTTYFTATDRVATDNNNNYTLTTGLGTSNASVRCVYDEWYWGSEREALENSGYAGEGGYEFTWGDREVY